MKNSAKSHNKNYCFPFLLTAKYPCPGNPGQGISNLKSSALGNNFAGGLVNGMSLNKNFDKLCFIS